MLLQLPVVKPLVINFLGFLIYRELLAKLDEMGHDNTNASYNYI